MIQSRNLNKQIKGIPKRSLQLILKNHKSSFDELLLKDNTIAKHHRIYKAEHSNTSEFMKEILKLKTPYSKASLLKKCNVKIAYCCNDRFV